MYRPRFGAGWWIALLVFGILQALCVARYLRGRKPGFILIQILGIEYVAFVIVFTLLSRKATDEYRVLVDLFWSYKKAISGNWRYLWATVFNILMYVPIGIWLRLLMKGRWALACAAGFSLLTELMQLVMKRGYFEFDDIISNTAGALIGCGMYLLYMAARRGIKALRE